MELENDLKSATELNFFPVRHLSPNCAYNLVQYLNEINPDIVLIEGPYDANDEISNIADDKVKPPIAILAYTSEMPVRTILYPLADYSPEYQAILWAKKNNKKARFIDLPSSVFLEIEEADMEDDNDVEDSNIDIYDALYKKYGDIDYDAFWERNFEQLRDGDYLRKAMINFGENIRGFKHKNDIEDAKNILRESFMKRQIQNALDEGYKKNKIVIVTGAYHTSSLMSDETIPLDDKEMESMPRVSSSLTLMPYSYYLLSDRSGYGAGNKAPYYFEKMWDYLNEGRIDNLPEYYLTSVVRKMREEGHIKSSAEVIEGVRLAKALSNMRGGSNPVLQDLRDGAKTCLGEGEFSKVSIAIADTEIGTKIGSLPDGMSNTSLQNNFNTMLNELKLSKYKSVVATDLTLDLRENRRVKSEKAAFLDLRRSSFLHQLEVLEVSFGETKGFNQNEADWKEEWIVSWRPETEIQIVQASLLGDTIEMAAAYKLKNKLDNCTRIEEVSEIIKQTYECGMEEMAAYSVKVLQRLAVDNNALDEISEAAFNLSYIIRFGSIRRINTKILEPILEELFYRASLILVSSCNCNNEAAQKLKKSIDQLDTIATYNKDIIDYDAFIGELEKLSDMDDKNPVLCGIACSILIEHGIINSEKLEIEIGRRLLPGISADIGAGWFEGLASRNRYVILSNMTIWEKLDEYISDLNNEELKNAIVFLHRTFSDFNSKEKYMIAENLSNIWGVDKDDLDEYLSKELSKEEEQSLDDLSDFDFGDF